MAIVLTQVDIDWTTFEYAIVKTLPLGVRKFNNVPPPMLRRNLWVAVNHAAPMQLGGAAMTDLERNELIVTVHQGGKRVGDVVLAQIKDGHEHLLNHLLGKPFPGLPLEIGSYITSRDV